LEKDDHVAIISFGFSAQLTNRIPRRQGARCVFAWAQPVGLRAAMAGFACASMAEANDIQMAAVFPSPNCSCDPPTYDAQLLRMRAKSRPSGADVVQYAHQVVNSVENSPCSRTTFRPGSLSKGSYCSGRSPQRCR